MDTQRSDGCYFMLALELGFVEDGPLRPRSRRREDAPPRTGDIPFTMWNFYRSGFARKSRDLESDFLEGRINCRSFADAYDELRFRCYEVEEAMELL